MLFITSDPAINSVRKLPAKRSDKLPVEVLNLIVPPPTVASCNLSSEPFNVSNDSCEDSSDDCSEDSS